MPVTINESDLFFIGGICILLSIGCILGFRHWWTIRRNAPEAELFLKARKYLHPLPILRISDADGNGFIALGEVDKKGDVVFKFSEAGGIQVNPRTQGIVPEDKINGIPFYNYSTTFPFPLSARNTLAFKTILDYSRNTFPQINFVSDLRLLELIALPVNQLVHDCQNIIDAFEQIPNEENIVSELTDGLGLSEDEQQITYDTLHPHRNNITTNDLVEIVKTIQAESHTIPIKNGYYSYDWAFARIPSSILAQDLNQMKLLIKRQNSHEDMDQYQKYIPLAFAVLIIIVGVVLLFMLAPPARQMAGI